MSSPINGNSPYGSPTGLHDREWIEVQKKTFTNWINNKLKLRNLEAVNSLETELGSGEKLIQVLEIIGDVDLGKYNKNPKMRIQKIENQNKALEFIRKRNVALTNIGAEDLVDNNFKLILGMIWSIILRFTIADISEGGLTAKEGLLLWVQKRTAPYKADFTVLDFTYSWTSGLPFCALIHRHRPDLLNYWELNKDNARENMALAFDIAEKHLGIAKLFNPEDILNASKPDERSILTYVAQYFHAFSTLDKVGTAGRRVDQFGTVMSQSWAMQHEYESRATALKSSILAKQEEWAKSSFTDYPDARRQLVAFESYKSSVKREWVTEKRELETLLSNIQTKLVTYHMSPYSPPAGLTMPELDARWLSLINNEADRKKAITSFIKGIKEHLKQKYAEKANAFAKALEAISSQLSELDGELEFQLDEIKNLQSQVSQMKADVEGLKQLEQQCNEANIEDNEYTIYSADDLDFEHTVLSSSLSKAEAFVENQIVARGITNIKPEQLESYTETFKHFDQDESNTLNRAEFKAALQAEGVRFAESEFEKVFLSASEGKHSLSFQQFIDFMRTMEEDKTTPEQLLEAFSALAHERDYITESDMVMGGLMPSVVQYFKTAIPAKTDTNGYDYKTYIAGVFGAKKKNSMVRQESVNRASPTAKTTFN